MTDKRIFTIAGSRATLIDMNGSGAPDAGDLLVTERGFKFFQPDEDRIEGAFIETSRYASFQEVKDIISHDRPLVGGVVVDSFTLTPDEKVAAFAAGATRAVVTMPIDVAQFAVKKPHLFIAYLVLPPLMIFDAGEAMAHAALAPRGGRYEESGALLVQGSLMMLGAGSAAATGRGVATAERLARGASRHARRGLRYLLGLTPEQQAAYARAAADPALRGQLGAIEMDPLTPLQAAVREAMDERNFERAIGLLRKAIAVETVRNGSPSALTLSNLGHALSMVRRGNDAIETYRQSLRIEEHPTTWRRLGTALRHAQRFEEALSASDRAIEMTGGTSLYPLVEKGITLRMMGRLDEAEAMLRKTLEIDSPDTWRALRELRIVFQRQGKGKDALAEVEASITMARRPDAIGSLKEQARGAMDAERFDDAAALYRNLIDAEIAKRGAPFAISALNLGRALRETRRIDDAIQAFRWALRIEEHPRTWCELGMALREAGNLVESLEALQRALALEPRPHGLTLAQLGVTLNRLGRSEESLAMIDRAIDVEGGRHGQTFIDLSSTLREMGRLDDALAAIERGIPLLSEGRKFSGLHEKGVVLRQLGRLDESLAALDEAIRLAKRPFINALTERGVTLRAMGRRDEAIEAIEASIRLKPDGTGRAHCELGIALREAGRLGEALAAFDHAIEIGGGSKGRALCEKGILLRSMGRPEQAVAEFDRSLALDPHRHRVLCEKAEALREMGRWDDALAAIDQAIAESGGRLHHYHFERSLTLRRMGRLDGALAAIDRAIAQSGRPDHQYLFERAVILRRMERWEEALDAIQESIHLGHRNLTAFTEMGITLRRLGRFEESLAAFDQGIASNPAATGRTLLERGITLREMGRLDDSLADIKRGIASEGGNNGYFFAEEAETLRQMGRLDEARAAVEEGIRIDQSNGVFFPPTFVQLAEICSAQGSHGLAQAALEGAIEKLEAAGTSYPPAHAQLLWVLMKRGEVDRAYGLLQRAYEKRVAPEELMEVWKRIRDVWNRERKPDELVAELIDEQLDVARSILRGLSAHRSKALGIIYRGKITDPNRPTRRK